MNVTLVHFWRSSASWRVRWALAIKGIVFESVMVDLLEGQQSEPAHLVRNPMGYVPAIQIDGRWMTESVAILELLEDLVPEPSLYPRDSWHKARVRQLVELVNSGLQPLQNLVVYQRHSADLSEQRTWCAFFNERGLAAAERLLESIHREWGGPFAAGEGLTAADLFLVPQVATARRFGVDTKRFPHLSRIEVAALATPHASGALPENQPGAERRKKL